MLESLFYNLSHSFGWFPAVCLFLIAGVGGLKFGADWLVEGAANLGRQLGMSKLMIGLTIVAFGTSAPELVVSILTAAQGKPELCLGNVVGSNIANTALILGSTALITPLNVGMSSLQKDIPISFLCAFFIFFLALIGIGYSRFDGVLLLTAFAVWMYLMWRKAKKSSKKEAVPLEHEGVEFVERPIYLDILWILAGLFVLILGARVLVVGAVETAQALNIPDVVVGLTIVAAGTSLPELAVCLVAALRMHGDMTIGNIMGSNIFNALLILGTAVVIAPIQFLPADSGWGGDRGTLWIDLPFCVMLCFLIWPLMIHKRSLTRGKGIFLIVLYVIYLVTLVMRNVN